MIEITENDFVVTEDPKPVDQKAADERRFQAEVAASFHAAGEVLIERQRRSLHEVAAALCSRLEHAVPQLELAALRDLAAGLRSRA